MNPLLLVALVGGVFWFMAKKPSTPTTPTPTSPTSSAFAKKNDQGVYFLVATPLEKTALRKALQLFDVTKVEDKTLVGGPVRFENHKVSSEAPMNPLGQYLAQERASSREALVSLADVDSILAKKALPSYVDAVAIPADQLGKHPYQNYVVINEALI